MPIQFFGQYLQERGILEASQLLKVLTRQRETNRRFGALALAKGLLSEEEVKRVLTAQLQMDIPFAEGAVELGFLSQEDMNAILIEQQVRHVYLGEILVELGFVTQEVITRELLRFEQSRQQFRITKIEVPEEVPIARLASNAFGLTKRMLMRVWGIECKAAIPAADLNTLPLPPIAAEVRLRGDVETRYMIGVDQDVAEWGALQFFDTMEIGYEGLGDATRELANIICGNLTAMLSRRGRTVKTSAPIAVTSEVVLGDHQTAVSLLFASPFGRVLVALTYPRAGQEEVAALQP